MQKLGYAAHVGVVQPLQKLSRMKFPFKVIVLFLNPMSSPPLQVSSKATMQRAFNQRTSCSCLQLATHCATRHARHDCPIMRTYGLSTPCPARPHSAPSCAVARGLPHSHI